MPQNIMVQGNTLSALASITVGASPFAYTNSYGVPIQIIIDKTSGISAIDVKRGSTTTHIIATTFNSLALILGVGDILTVTYATTTPVMNAMPIT